MVPPAHSRGEFCFILLSPVVDDSQLFEISIKKMSHQESPVDVRGFVGDGGGLSPTPLQFPPTRRPAPVLDLLRPVVRRCFRGSWSALPLDADGPTGSLPTPSRELDAPVPPSSRSRC